MATRWARSVPKYDAIYVLGRAGAVSGGPDALHRLAHTLRDLGARAFISYVPLGTGAEVPKIYQSYYHVTVGQPIDAPTTLIVLPEVMAHLARDFRQARKAVWWLSVDHFFGCNGKPGQLERRRVLHDLKSMIGLPGGRIRWAELRRIDHYSPSAYAATFLREHCIEAQPLHDPVNATFMTRWPERARRDAIAYNPAKDQHYAPVIRAALAEFEWIELAGMSHKQIAATLGSVKAYLDFGYFPGRERLPAEAVLCGACLVTARRGAARFYEDLPIPEYYKINHQAKDYATQVRNLLLDIFANFERRAADFDYFRMRLRREPAAFIDEVRAAFFGAAAPKPDN
jgi:hypothetical protein